MAWPLATCPRKGGRPTRQPVAGGKGLGSRIHEHFAQLGGVELELPERSSLPIPAEFGSDAELAR